ncbi:yip1d-interacting factor 1 [Leptinotarsa decemlineata]|uniref:yip1d-interacting factor 1 n=1 Tax=Leptinotarsa decemlineata TaxID=7539 RepID=UPI000C253FD4|nr:protein YIF1B [Leptinotarsa decemlineata]
MNYNANSGGRQPLTRKLKRVTDVNSMGFNPYDQGQGPQPQQNIYPNLDPSNLQQQQNLYPNLNQNTPFQQGFANVQFDSFSSTPKIPQGQPPNFSQTPFSINPIGATNLSVLNQPVVQDMALQYGQQLAGAGKTMLKNEVERYLPVTKLKYYFAVDTHYVLSKLLLLFFPFTHKDWSVKYEQDGPVQPRFEINVPDLYIPTMAYITYLLVSGIVLGMQERFTPEQIGMLSSSALAWCIVELVVYKCTLYIINVETSLRTLDLLAYAGYKFVGIITSISISILGGRTGYYSSLLYTNLALSFFLVRSLKVQVLTEAVQDTSYYGGPQTTAGHKRRLYFLLFLAAVQPVLSWWLSYHLLPNETLDKQVK